jgi:large subunit ribosomal protein L21
MYAVFETGGKQYRAQEGDVIRIEKLEAGAGTSIDFEKVLLVSDGDNVKIGAPYVAGGKVNATIKAHGRGDKIRIIKHRRRKHYHREQGHRQHYTEVQITGISSL